MATKKFDSIDRKANKRVGFLRREEIEKCDELERKMGIMDSFPNKRCEECGKLLRDCECDD